MLDAVDANEQTVVALGGLHRPESRERRAQVLTDALRNVLTLSHQQGTGRAHPVQGACGAAVGVNENRAVVLHHEQAGGARKVGAQAAS